MKDYLNSQECWDIIKIGKQADELEEIIAKWNENGNLTKEESKYYKMALSFIMKAWEMILRRMDNSTLEKIKKRRKTMSLYFVDKYQEEQMNKKIKERATELYKDKYYRLVEISMYYNCCNCTKKCSECYYYEEYVDNLVPDPSGENYAGKQCKYGYEDKGRNKNEL